jgi:ABC-type lipoprotein release transport system permease subunit
MWHFLLLCWRDLWRNRRRTLLVGFVMVFAVSIMILFIGLGTGAHDLMIRSATDSFLGHAQIQRTGYLEEPDLEHQIPAADLAKLGNVLPAAENVVGWAPRLVAGGLISKKRPDPADEDDLDAYRQMISEGALLVGIKPEAERSVSTLASSLVADDPQARCLRGCAAALAEIYATADSCEELCADAGEEFGGEACIALGTRTCSGRCAPDDEYCYEEDCRERFADYCGAARFLLDVEPESDSPHRSEIVLGSTLARVLDVDVGDRVALTTGTSQGRPFASLYRVVGLIKTGSTDINRTFSLTYYEKLSAGLELPGAASFVVVAVDNPDDASAIAATINETLETEAPDTVALGWAEISPELDIFVKIDQGSMLVMLGLLIAIIGVILANIVTMSVMERTREYGVRLAVGESHRRIVIGLIVEIAMLAITFSLIGAALGEAANFYFQSHPIDFGMGTIETTGVIIETKYPTVPTVYGFFFAVGTVVFFSVAGALYPAWKVRKLRPVDALRFV